MRRVGGFSPTSTIFARPWALKWVKSSIGCCLRLHIRAEVRCGGRTGVEMEALTAASTAALTVYDMCKAIQRDIIISDIRLLEKTGGIHGDFVREEH